MDCACSMGVGSMTLMMLIPALILAGLVIGGLVLVRRLWRGSALTEFSSPLDILEERYARGEIDRDELDERREYLRS